MPAPEDMNWAVAVYVYVCIPPRIRALAHGLLQTLPNHRDDLLVLLGIQVLHGSTYEPPWRQGRKLMTRPQNT